MFYEQPDGIQFGNVFFPRKNGGEDKTVFFAAVMVRRPILIFQRRASAGPVCREDVIFSVR